MSINDWRAPFKRPNKISENGTPVQISCELSEDEFEFMQQLAAGYGMVALARGFQCDVATIHRTIRRVAKKITEQEQHGLAKGGNDEIILVSQPIKLS